MSSDAFEEFLEQPIVMSILLLLYAAERCNWNTVGALTQDEIMQCIRHYEMYDWQESEIGVARTLVILGTEQENFNMLAGALL